MKYIPIAAALLLGACNTVPNNFNHDGSITNTMALIAQTEAHAPNSVPGEFEFLIKAADEIRGHVYLNTELDYRDRRSISITMSPSAVRDFVAKYNQSPKTALVNKQIRVTGEAQRVTIDFYSQGRRTDKYYFQTHIDVTELSQLTVLN
ncbi:hypothetical protein HG263_12905 [Pseudoalteromonas sp. JBTF-M23]|uniref:Uncharacterized protein n=1 Tax=Pseudoalteromonas caenipelagi TaxID=2726988 RepID=A0A849VCN0_9GAMM|nr:hypothetical protein [Pseudoalteromonas caenipelagi]NOU51429.1 hypothetical protein [Pseudoalteromonas caenipelagi]